jgi:hypothetical protein
VDYDLWTGPAQKKPFTENRFHYNWHWFWDFGNGDLGNQGIHEVDIARWGLGVKYPTKVSAVGGKFMFDDDQETPNTLNCAFEFNENNKKQMMEFEVRHWMSNHESGIGEDGRALTMGYVMRLPDGRDVTSIAVFKRQPHAVDERSRRMRTCGDEKRVEQLREIEAEQADTRDGGPRGHDQQYPARQPRPPLAVGIVVRASLPE